MIAYRISKAKLRKLIDAEAPGWSVDAKNRTKELAKIGRYEETSSNWSKVKPVFVRLQNFKCIYCERQYADLADGGSIEYDLEHFRPKNPVEEWLAPLGSDLPISFGGEYPNGYYWLAYNPLNYAVSCK